MKPLLEIRNLSAGYDSLVVLYNINLVIHDLDFVGIIGPNGGGKTTLLKTILGLLPPVSGEIIFDEAMSSDNSSRIGYLPQINNIDRKFPISVFDVVRSGLMSRKRLIGKFTHEENGRAKDLLNEMGIFEIRNKAIGELSGGQIQRTLLCRALVNNPKLLILDEPSTYVDNRFEKELYEKLGKLNDHLTILLVSHDLGTISTYVKSFACVNGTLHYHAGNELTPELLESYECPIQIISHGEIPHTVLYTHKS
jgi:zinc transport system ATP-binding protein